MFRRNQVLSQPLIFRRSGIAPDEVRGLACAGLRQGLTMKKLLIAAASLTLLAGSAYAQGNSPYNSSGSQAGGPRGGMERAAEGAAMEQGAAPAARPMMRKRMKHKRTMKHHRRMRHHM
jgi:hypothetical protein